MNAVLFGELLGATDLYVEAGDAAAHATITRAAELVARAAADSDARLVKTMGSRLMLLTENGEAGAAAACAMQSVAAGLPAPLSLGVGLHCGPVIEENADVFGDAVNLAARLVEQAARGQILIAAETADALGETYRHSIRRLYSIPVKGRSEKVTLCELLWRADDTLTVMPFLVTTALRSQLTIRYRGVELLLRHGRDALTIGRGDDCGLVLEDSQASRHHCMIQERNGHFVIVDRSTNGTYVTVAGEGEVLLEHDELTLRKRGWISFGTPRAESPEAAEFCCD